MAARAQQVLPSWRDATSLRWFTTTDHKRLGVMYITVGLAMGLAVGISSVLLAFDLAHAPFGLLEQFAHDQVAILRNSGAVFAVGLPIALGLTTAVAPLQVGARRLALAELNAVGFWIVVGGALLVLTSPAAGNPEAPDPEVPEALQAALASPLSPQGRDFWALGLLIICIGSLLSATSLVATLAARRAAGISAARMPAFAVASLLFGVTVIVASLILGAVTAVFLIDPASAADAFPFDVIDGDGALAFYAQPFWFFANPFALALLLPVLGGVSEILATFGRTALRGRGLVAVGLTGVAGVAIALAIYHAAAAGFSRSFDDSLGYAGLIVLAPVALVAVGWVATILGAKRRLGGSPLLLALGAFEVLLLGAALGLALGFPGEYNSVGPLGEFTIADSFHLTGHYEGALAGALIVGLLASLHYWFPKLTGRTLNPRLALLQAVLVIVGVNAMLVGEHVIGESNIGRGLSSLATSDWSSGGTVGAIVTIAGVLLVFFGLVGFVAESIKSLISGTRVGNDPWHGGTLEWYTTSPPPPHNFETLPEIKSARPLADLRRRLEASRG